MGADIQENRFNASVQLSNRHPSNYTFVEEPLTIEFRAVVTGLAKKVRATSRISFIQNEVKNK